MMILTIPNILTALRILLTPFIIISFYQNQNLLTLYLYSIACITDYLDGYLSRVLNQNSFIGEIIDPIADKILVVSLLIILTQSGKFDKFLIIPVLIILIRESLISNLREISIKINNKILSVSILAKFKTLFQMVAIGTFLIEKGQNFLLLTGRLFLWIASLLSLITFYSYFKNTYYLIIKNKNNYY